MPCRQPPDAVYLLIAYHLFFQLPLFGDIVVKPETANVLALLVTHWSGKPLDKSRHGTRQFYLTGWPVII
jgi:hypothetical protein